MKAIGSSWRQWEAHRGNGKLMEAMGSSWRQWEAHGAQRLGPDPFLWWEVAVSTLLEVWSGAHRVHVAKQDARVFVRKCYFVSVTVSRHGVVHHSVRGPTCGRSVDQARARSGSCEVTERAGARESSSGIGKGRTVAS